MNVYKRISIAIIIIIILLLVWSYIRAYEGNKISVGMGEAYFGGREYNEGDDAVFFVINDRAPIEIYVTNELNYYKISQGPDWSYLKGHHYNVGPYEKIEIKFTALADDTYGLVIMSRTDERAEFKVQNREPPAYGHIRYSIGVFYSLSFALALLICIAFYYSISNRKPNDDILENDVVDDDGISICPYCKGNLLWHEYSQRFYCSHCQMFV